MTYYVRVRSYKDYSKAIKVLYKHSGNLLTHHQFYDCPQYNYIAFKVGDRQQYYYFSLDEVENRNTHPFIEVKIPKQIKYNTYLLEPLRGQI